MSQQKLEVERISRKAFDSLPEYSCSNPTGVIIGKVWKSRKAYYSWMPGHDEWVICEYVAHPTDPNMAQIELRTPEIIEPAMQYTAKRPKGGHLNHAVPVGKYSALCGYEPSSPNAHLMRARSGWTTWPDAKVTCKKCLEKLEKGAQDVGTGDSGKSAVAHTA